MGKSCRWTARSTTTSTLPVDPTNPNKFPGFSFQKTNLGFGYLSIKFQLPPVTGTRSLLQPIFADRK